MSQQDTRRSPLPWIIGGLCVVLAALVWQVIPRQPAGLAQEDIPTTLEEAAPVDPVLAAVERRSGAPTPWKASSS